MKNHKIPVKRIIESDRKNKPKMTGAEMFETAIRALGEIKNNQGHVCGMFEICTHEACRSSHAAWEIADRALNKIKQR
ncbi:hypothetical protein KAR91_73710 [Candidatus Pacearchaeota archaeon]|nr:hypothetical protein [Candidatus Pacearchaeota archaeon]